MIAVKWAKEIAEYLNTKYAAVSCQVYTEVLGDLRVIYWYADYKDLATVESVLTQIMSDQGYWALVNKGVEFFIDGSFKDKLMKAI